MIYIIGGLPRSGKTIIKNMVLDKYKISGIDTDNFRELFNGDPSSQISFNSQSEIITATTALWPYLESFMEGFIISKESIVISGEAIRATLISKYKNSTDVKICFLGSNDIDSSLKLASIRKYKTMNDWTNNHDDKRLLEILDKYIGRSNHLRNICNCLDIKYFNTAIDFENTISQAIKYLMS